MPDLVPLARWGLIALAVIVALATAASAAGQWETVLLWRNQVPFAASGPPVVDPVFGRDASYYLFELPFLRAGQALVNGLLIAALGLSIARYLLAGIRGGLTFTTQMRLHLAILGGLYLLSVAVGYQLDKLELVYSTQGITLDPAAGIRAVGVSFTDQNARFLAFDVLTAISAFAGAFLVIGAFTRAMWPLGAVIIVWFSASVVLGTIYPGLVQRISVEPDQLEPGDAVHRQQHQHDPDRLRRGRLGTARLSGEAPLTADAIAREDATFQNARLWDYRPLRDTLDQLQTVRQYYHFTDVDTDRYMLSGTTRQVMLSARELAPENNPQGGTWVNQRITFTHGIGLAMVPVNEASEGGQPQLIIRDLPPVSSAGAPTITQPRIYFGERSSDWILTGARQSEFDYPVGSTTSAGGAESGQTTRWSGTSGVRLDTTLSRLLFALRFRDLNLLISDQVTADSQLLFHRSLADRLPRIAPFLRFDKDPYLVVTDDGRLVYIQDAYTTSDRFPNAQWFDPATLADTDLGSAPFNYIRNSVKIVEDAYTGDMSFYVSDPDDPIIRTYERIFPPCSSPSTRSRRISGRTCGSPRSCSTSRPGHSRAITSRTRLRSTTTRTCGPWRRAPRAAAEPAQRGLLRRDADAGRVGPRVPAPSADGPEHPSEHDRLGRRPDGPARLRRRPGLPVPRRTRRSSGPNQIEAQDRRGSGHRRPDDALEPVGEQGHPGQPDRDADPGLAGLPPAGLPPVGEQRLPGVPADRRRDVAEDRLGPFAQRGPGAVCSPAAVARRRARSDA